MLDRGDYTEGCLSTPEHCHIQKFQPEQGEGEKMNSCWAQWPPAAAAAAMVASHLTLSSPGVIV